VLHPGECTVAVQSADVLAAAADGDGRMTETHHQQTL